MRNAKLVNHLNPSGSISFLLLLKTFWFLKCHMYPLGVIFHGKNILNIFKNLTLSEKNKTATNCSLVNIIKWIIKWLEVWRQSGFMVIVLTSGSSGLALSPGQRHLVVFFHKTLNFTVLLSTQVPGNFMLGGTLFWTCIPPRGSRNTPEVALCYRNRDEFQPDGLPFMCRLSSFTLCW